MPEGFVVSTDHPNGGEAPAIGAERFERCTPQQRTDAIRQLLALQASTQANLMDLVVAADRAEDWRVDGTVDMAAWLVLVGGTTLHHARELLRTARRLQRLPALAGTFAEGRLCWEQVRPAARLATPEDDAEVAAEVVGWSAAQIEAAARSCRSRSTQDDEQSQASRSLRFRADAEAGGEWMSGFLPAEMAATVHGELARRAEAAGADATTGRWERSDARLADALFDLCAEATADRSDPQDAVVVVHVDADVVDGAAGGAGLVADQPISRDGVLRLLCSDMVEYSIEDEHGRTVGIGRASRVVPRWLRRRILQRDGGCRYPRCPRKIRHAHHIRHWTAEGPTNEDNLIGLCWHHHRRVHEGGWTIEGDPRGEVAFVSPTGRRVSSLPAVLRADIARRLGLDGHDPPPSN